MRIAGIEARTKYIVHRKGDNMFVNERDIRKRMEVIKEQLNTLSKLIYKLPEGELVCAKNGKNYKWYKKTMACMSIF